GLQDRQRRAAAAWRLWLSQGLPRRASRARPARAPDPGGHQRDHAGDRLARDVPAMSEEAEVLFERRGAVGLITLNRPKALNALTHNMCVLMMAQLKAWAGDDAVKTVVVQG